MRNDRFVKAIGLLELMLVLAIAAIILLMAVSYYRTAMATQQVNSGYKDTETIVAAARSYWVDHDNSYSGITNIDVLIDNGYLTEEFKFNPWGDTEVTALARDKLQVSMSDINIKACRALAMRFGLEQNINTVCQTSATDVTTMTVCTTGIKRYEACTS